MLASKTMATLDSTFLFTEKTFDLIAELHKKPKYSVYQAKRTEFQEHVINPFKDLLNRVAKSLPSRIADRMETEKYLFSYFKKMIFIMEEPGISIGEPFIKTERKCSTFHVDES